MNVEPQAAATSPTTGPYAVELVDISKTFGEVKANDRVSFDLRWGEIHGLLGENGAGKSTLCAVMSGLYRPDEGRVSVDGTEHRFRSPREALAAGVGMVYQHFRLVPTFTAAENLALGDPTVPRRASNAVLVQRAQELAERYGVALDPEVRVRDMAVGQQQQVEILRLLGRGVRVMILDEPTAVLTPQESATLFRTVEAMAASGTAVVLVSHKLDEVIRVCRRVTVMRDGTTVASLDSADTSPAALAAMMMGRPRAAAAPVEKRAPRGEPHGAALELEALTASGMQGHAPLGPVTMQVAPGEIVGVAGVAGNGQRELAEAIAGVRPIESGRLVFEGADVTRAGVRDRANRGLAYVPEDRLHQGIAAGLSFEDNVILRRHWRPEFSRGPFLNRAGIRAAARAVSDRFEIKGLQAGQPVGSLSGGNIQRLILARETVGDPRILIVASPTRGLDPGATATVRDILREERDAGKAVLLISEDLDELLELADRVLVFFRGRIAGEVVPGEVDLTTIGLLMAGQAQEAL